MNEKERKEAEAAVMAELVKAQSRAPKTPAEEKKYQKRMRALREELERLRRP